MANIIIPHGKSLGKTRSEQEENMKNEGWGRTLTDEQLDKCKFAEKKFKDKYGSDQNFLSQVIIDRVK